MYEAYLSDDHIGYLNDRVFFGFWENPLAPCALNVKTQDPKWSYVRPFSLRCMRNKIFPGNIYFYLRPRHKTSVGIDWIGIYSEMK